MTAASEEKPDLAAVQEDIAALKRDVANLIEHLKAGATNGAQSAAGQLDEAAQRLYRSVAAEGGSSVSCLTKIFCVESPVIAGRPLARCRVPPAGSREPPRQRRTGKHDS